MRFQTPPPVDAKKGTPEFDKQMQAALEVHAVNVELALERWVFVHRDKKPGIYDRKTPAAGVVPLATKREAMRFTNLNVPGLKMPNLVTIWMGADPDDEEFPRAEVVDIRFRPDMPPEEIYAEEGEQYYNTYIAPVHAKRVGSTKVFHEALKHTLPTEREREYYKNWMAVKIQRPWDRGHAVVLVDEAGGAGKSILGEVMCALVGREGYGRPVEYRQLAGGSTHFNAWRENTLFAVTDEAWTQKGVGYKDHAQAYETLKEVIDTGGNLADITLKGVDSRLGRVFCMHQINTNHADALPLSMTDRRFVILSCGGTMSADLAERWVKGWCDKPENIAALYHELQARDISDFNYKHEPMETPARLRMQGLAENPVDKLASIVAKYMFENRTCVTLLGWTESMGQAAAEHGIHWPVPLEGSKEQRQAGALYRKLLSEPEGTGRITMNDGSTKRVRYIANSEEALAGVDRNQRRADHDKHLLGFHKAISGKAPGPTLVKD